MTCSRQLRSFERSPLSMMSSMVINAVIFTGTGQRSPPSFSLDSKTAFHSQEGRVTITRYQRRAGQRPNIRVPLSHGFHIWDLRGNIQCASAFHMIPARLTYQAGTAQLQQDYSLHGSPEGMSVCPRVTTGLCVGHHSLNSVPQVAEVRHRCVTDKLSC